MIIVVFTRESSPVTVRAHGILTPTVGGEDCDHVIRADVYPDHLAAHKRKSMLGKIVLILSILTSYKPLHTYITSVRVQNSIKYLVLPYGVCTTTNASPV
jgi:hypothetical protein